MRPVLLIGSLALGACAQPPAWVVLELDEAEVVSFAQLPPLGAVDTVRAVPAAALVSVVRSGHRLVLTLDAHRARPGVRIEVPGYCAETLSAIATGSTTRLRPRRSLTVTVSQARPGFDAAVHAEATPGCEEAARLPLEWRVVAGTLTDVRIGREGRTLDARTLPAPPSSVSGIVPVSPRTSGEVVLEVHSSGIVRARVRLAAADRASGLPNVAVGGSLRLAGGTWSVLERPPGAKAQVSQGIFAPDRGGRWVIGDATTRLSIFAGRHDETPLDCARCHASLAAAAARSAMTTALTGRFPAVACAVACHATGDPSASDGGFVAVARELGRADLRFASLSDLPVALRRVSGVTCTGCHGPGTIPEPESRWAILRDSVCAQCHDAPPRYAHVVAWSAQRMAGADRTPASRVGACARCHTTAGFLGMESRAAPRAIGLGCAACHAPHSAPTHRLLREVPLPTVLFGALVAGPARICVPCHAPGPGDGGPPSASAAALFTGRGGVDPETGQPLVGPAPHAAIERGCLGCHRGSAEPRGATHSFASNPSSCAPCHPNGVDTPGIDRALREQATRLLARLGIAHAHSDPTKLPDSPLGRAAYDVLLVLLDPAAGAHGAAYARALLASAGKVLDDGTGKVVGP